MKELFQILDVFHIEKIGVVISGNGPGCDIVSKEEVKQSIGSKILIEFKNGKKEIYDVQGKDVVFPCFSSDPHWGILISLDITLIERGAIAYNLVD